MISKFEIRKSYHWISAVLLAAINGGNRKTWHITSDISVRK